MAVIKIVGQDDLAIGLGDLHNSRISRLAKTGVTGMPPSVPLDFQKPAKLPGEVHVQQESRS